MKRIVASVLLTTTLLGGLSACGAPAVEQVPAASEASVSLGDLEGAAFDESAYLPAVELDGLVTLEDEAVALSAAPAAVTTALMPQQGSKTAGNQRATIDYSNIADGYVMVHVAKDTGKRWKAQVKGPTTTYTYNLTATEWEVFSLSDGNGDYQVAVFENVTGNRYAAVASTSFKVALKDEFSPFLYPNQFVDYEAAPNTVAKAAEVTAGKATELEKVAAVYDYVVGNFTYDTQLAATVTSGYLPKLDQVLEKKSGICFDYAAMMTGMLRSQGVPCKLVVGYAGTAYHAWINVWSASDGWVDGVIYFNGSAWQRMDPTFASSGGRSESIMKYIGDGANYSAKYFY